MINFVSGYVEKRRGRVLIAHVVNNRGVWGAGFTQSLERQFLGAGAAYREFVSTIPLADRLGKNIYCDTSSVQRVTICHMIAQNGLRSKDNPVPLDYGALRQCLNRLANDVLLCMESPDPYLVIRMPRIGSGLAGGDWLTIRGMIISELGNLPIPVEVYSLPGVQ